MQEEKTYREKQWASLEHTAAAELHSQMSVQLRGLTATQQRNRDGNINEIAARVLETSQQVKSTNGFGEDPLAVHTWLQDNAPRLAPYATDDFIGSDDEHACMASSAVVDVEGVTAVVIPLFLCGQPCGPGEMWLAAVPRLRSRVWPC